MISFAPVTVKCINQNLNKTKPLCNKHTLREETKQIMNQFHEVRDNFTTNLVDQNLIHSLQFCKLFHQMLPFLQIN